MARVIDLTNQEFNRLTAKRLVGRDKWGQTLWECECSCKDHKIIIVRAGDLKSGRVKSCGCLLIEHAKGQAEKNYKPNSFMVTEDPKVSLMTDSRGNSTFVDTEDVERLSKFCWYKHTNGYWVSYTPFQQLHRFIMNCPRGKVVDHVNFDKDDHRKSELKVCSQRENNQNTRTRNTKIDKDLPVCVRRTKSNRYEAFITRNGIHYCKTFDSVEECVVWLNDIRNKVR